MHEKDAVVAVAFYQPLVELSALTLDARSLIARSGTRCKRRQQFSRIECQR
jgi:hypothetical protein